MVQVVPDLAYLIVESHHQFIGFFTSTGNAAHGLSISRFRSHPRLGGNVGNRMA
jgi:hypothetical protein